MTPLRHQYCAWCRRWFVRDADRVMYVERNVKPITHGICPKCKSDFLKDIKPETQTKETTTV